MAARSVPEVAPLKALRLPTVADRTLGNGLRLIAARRPGIPRFEVRLRILSGRKKGAADAAVANVLSRTLLSGTSTRTSVQIAQELQRLGGGLDAGLDPDHVVLHGSALSSELPRFLALLSEVLLEATHPDDEVELQREVVAQEVTLARSQPGTIAREALFGRLYGDHPYGRPMPSPEELAAVDARAVRRLHDKRLAPAGAVLVLVGDVQPAKALDLAEGALAAWADHGGKPGLTAPPAPVPGPALVIDRPGSVQTTVRIGGAAVDRSHPDYPALALANLVFGGYFVSRLVDNIRERRGYTYSPGSGVQQFRSASLFFVQADVGTEVTGPALVEIDYELRRMLVGPIEEAELTSAKRYLAGTASMGIQTQAGLAGTLASLAGAGLPVEHLRDFPAAVQALDEEAVVAAARTYLDPRRLQSVLVGDLASIRPAVEALGPIEQP